MKTMTYLYGILLTLSVATAAAQDKKTEPPAAVQDVNLETSKGTFSSALSGGKVADLILPDHAPLESWLAPTIPAINPLSP